VILRRTTRAQPQVCLRGKQATRPGALLAICAAVQVLGLWYETSAGERVDGVGLIDATTSPQPARTIGELVTRPLLAGPGARKRGREDGEGGADAAAALDEDASLYGGGAEGDERGARDGVAVRLARGGAQVPQAAARVGG
jgi:CobQ-like glutamine amidotransferase family enzyme